MTRVVPAVLLGTSVLLLSACGPSDSSGSSPSTKAAAPDSSAPGAAISSTTGSAPADAPTPTAPATAAAPSKPAGGSGGAAAPGGANTLTITGSKGGTFQFDPAGCLGKKSPSGGLTLTAAGGPDKKVALVVTFDGQGQVALVLTVGGDAGDDKAAVWGGKAAVGATVSRTEDAVKIVGLPVSQLPDAVDATVSGSLKCESADALF
ncbi:hypothetical protein ACFVXG_42395 [Kitasatospora sp. NPDC058162]|uniref:hypothetical protein n=1 Tax=Kitasatospora sp. NPDC058162 TaxID=3346362 RepID=UPI0036DC89C4